MATTINAQGSSSKAGIATSSNRSGTNTMRDVPWPLHATRQLKLLVPGAALTWYLNTVQAFWWVLSGERGFWAFLAACCGTMLGLFTITLFLYVLFLPKITGEEPNYRTWRESKALSVTIPVLTASIVVGWLMLVTTLGQWSTLGYVQSTVGVTAFYALTLGMLGLVPAPKPSSRKVRD
ncbi:hypothetical protein CPB83DRAFT_847079 [Crepidotus variabilis]|uniref:Uncharacterized protein n=1 Tax=Crepidotus variabilis TaxID=179855 RepID=A0A9P6EPA3_9AGAR|nr:hypothetical protein CPB83DRAFT_847079 [Crepidotus variabilis]